MLSIVLAGNPHVPPFTLFLAEQRDYKTINMDQWTGFLRFTQEVIAQALNRLHSNLHSALYINPA